MSPAMMPAPSSELHEGAGHRFRRIPGSVNAAETIPSDSGAPTLGAQPNLTPLGAPSRSHPLRDS